MGDTPIAIDMSIAMKILAVGLLMAAVCSAAFDTSAPEDMIANEALPAPDSDDTSSVPEELVTTSTDSKNKAGWHRWRPRINYKSIEKAQKTVSNKAAAEKKAKEAANKKTAEKKAKEAANKKAAAAKKPSHACAAGKFGGHNGASSCKNCPSGRYSYSR